MDNIFEEVKQKTSILQVCDMLGLKLNRVHQCLCPFHNEKSPSFSVQSEKGIFYCFGCGEKGDMINLVSKIYNVKQLEAAKIINQNLGLGIEFKNNEKNFKNKYIDTNTYKQNKKIEEHFNKWLNKTLQMLCDYYHLLLKLKEYDWESDLYLEYANNVDYIDDLIDNFINGKTEDKIWYWKNKRKEVLRIGTRIECCKAIIE